MSIKWDYDATASLLRFGRKNGGPWEDGSVPDDGDTEMVVSAPQVAADYAALLARHNALLEAVEWERECWDAEMWVQHRLSSPMLIAAYWESDSTYKKARAEVDRLLLGES